MAPRQRPAGRICGDPVCSTVLSIYNDGHFCALHQPRIAMRTRGKKEKKAA
ncbi:MAG: hypothetical protein ACRDV4_11905 [Acidimicrobiales bacterium]